MGIKFIADTHAVLWYLTADARLGANAKAAFENPNNQIIIPAIVVAESLFIIEHGKSPAASSQLWDFILRSMNVTFYPLDLAVLKKSEMLSIIPEMHDRQIIATALARFMIFYPKSSIGQKTALPKIIRAPFLCL